MNARVLIIELDDLFCSPLAYGLCFRHRRHRWRPACIEELCILLLAVLRQPIDVKELRQGAFEWGRVEPRGMKRRSLFSGSRKRKV
jgi:hypothetical protein